MTRIITPIILVTLLLGVAGYLLNTIPLLPPHAGPVDLHERCPLEVLGLPGLERDTATWSVFAAAGKKLILQTGNP